MYQHKKISLSEETLKEVEKYQKKNGLDSNAQSLRELIEIGLKAKEIVSKKNVSEISKKDFKKEDITVPKTVWMDHLKWILETRLLVRYLVQNMPGQPKAIGADFLEKYKKRAVEYIENIYRD